MRAPRRMGFAGLRVKVATVWAGAQAAPPGAARGAGTAKMTAEYFTPALFPMGLARAMGSTAGLAAILLVGDVFEPADMLAVEVLLQCEMHHLGVGTGAMPMLLIGCDPHRVARADLAHRTAPQLHASDAGDDMQGLAKGVGMPCGPRARLEAHPGASDSRRRGGLDYGVLPHRSGERFGGPAARRRGTQRLDIHEDVSSVGRDCVDRVLAPTAPV